MLDAWFQSVLRCFSFSLVSVFVFWFLFFFVFFFSKNPIEDGASRVKTVVARVSLVVTFMHWDNFGMF